MSLSLDFATLEALSRIPVDVKGEEGFCPFKLLGRRMDPPHAVLYRVLAVAAGTTPEKVAAMRPGKELVPAVLEYCGALVLAFAPEKGADEPPKA